MWTWLYLGTSIGSAFIMLPGSLIMLLMLLMLLMFFFSFLTHLIYVCGACVSCLYIMSHVSCWFVTLLPSSFFNDDGYSLDASLADVNLTRRVSLQ